MILNIMGIESITLTNNQKKYLSEFKKRFLKEQEYNNDLELKNNLKLSNEEKERFERVVSWHIRVDMKMENINVKTSTINYYLNQLCKMQVLKKESSKGSWTIFRPDKYYDLAIKQI
jgi:hypothetical protein